MLTVFKGMKGTIISDILETGATINSASNCQLQVIFHAIEWHSYLYTRVALKVRGLKRSYDHVISAVGKAKGIQAMPHW